MEPPVGAAFGRALAAGGVTEDLARMSAAADGIVLLLLAAGIASLLKLAQGSGTVAILTGSAIVASLLPELDALAFHPGYLFAAVGFGSMAASWMNDSGFWVVGRMSGFSEGDTFRTWTAVAAAVGIFGLVQVLVLAAVFPSLEGRGAEANGAAGAIQRSAEVGFGVLESG